MLKYIFFIVPLYFLLFFINYGFCFSSAGQIDDNLHYSSLKLDGNYLIGSIENKSSDLKKNVRIRFDSYDVLTKSFGTLLFELTS